MRNFSFALGAALVFAGSAAPDEAMAAKKVWNAERYANCLKTAGTDALDETLVITATGCRIWYSNEERSEGFDGTLTIMMGASGGIPKDSPGQAQMAIAVALSLKATASSYGGNTLSADSGRHFELDSATIIIGGERKTYPVVGVEKAEPKCSSFANKRFASADCEFPEYGAIMLSDADVVAIRSQYEAEPLGDLRVLLKSASRGSIYAKLPLAEIVAVHKAWAARVASLSPPAVPAVNTGSAN